MLSSLAVSSATIFVAELGDKSQLMAMTFATRYRAWQVLVGITLATTLVHAASVALGVGVGSVVAAQWVSLLAGLAFLGFAVWTLRGDRLTQAQQQRASKHTRSVILAVTVAFFLAELGDKTMLATVTLAASEHWLGTWVGSTLGMVLADALAIGVGLVLGKHLPQRLLRYGAATLFTAFGLWLVGDAILGAM